MQAINKHVQHSNQLRRLTGQQQREPVAVLRYFFECYHLQELHEDLWDWLVAALSSDSGNYQNGIQRSNLIFLYENIESLAEASFLLCLKHHRKKTKKKKNRQQ